MFSFYKFLCGAAWESDVNSLSEPGARSTYMAKIIYWEWLKTISEIINLTHVLFFTLTLSSSIDTQTQQARFWSFHRLHKSKYCFCPVVFKLHALARCYVYNMLNKYSYIERMMMITTFAKCQLQDSQSMLHGSVHWQKRSSKWN